MIGTENIEENKGRFRLVTRSDFDGLVCAALLKEMGLIREITFVHPKDMQDGLIEIGPDDITTNLPYVKGAHISFDHHGSEMYRMSKRSNLVIDPDSPSTARVVYDYFGGKERFPRISDEILDAVDRSDSGKFTREDVISPKGWALLNFIMDSRTGLGRFKDFTISNYQLMMKLIDYCVDHSIEEILELSDVKERLKVFFDNDRNFREQIQRCSVVHDKLVVLDLRRENVIWPGNRFLIYTLFPECSLSMHVMWGKERKNTVFALGKSIFDLSASVNVGEVCLYHGGGGHPAAGTCQVPNEEAESVKEELVERLKTGK